jgi:hypothetical protein
MLRILVLSTFDGRNANVIRDFLFAFNAHSRHRYFYVFDCASLDDRVDLAAFDVILVFWSVYLLGPDLGPAVRDRIRAAPALKVLFLQDEYRDVRPMNAAMRELGIQVMFTCVAEVDHEAFYPSSLIPTLEATYHVLPGYVPAYLEGLPRPPDGPRPLDVGYRSRDVPFWLGDLGREKRIIADRFQAISAAHGLRADISVREADRLYGARWVSFLRRSRCVLGTASGASVVDFTGEIRRRCALHLELHPEATYADVKARFFADVDGALVIDTVSPRVFEAAALHCTMVNHEGGYAGLLEPDRHYIRVRRDYSNVGEVVDRIRDHGFCREMAARAHRDLVASGRHGYRAFAREFDDRLARHVEGRSAVRGMPRMLFYARRYDWSRRAILPWGGRFVAIPSPADPLNVMRRALASLPAGHRWAPASRLLQDPGRFMRMSRTAARVIVGTPHLRTLLRSYLREGGRRAGVPASRLVEDLVKIDIVRRARSGILRARPSFVVEIAFEAEGGTLILTSRATPETSAPAPPRVPVEIERALREGRVERITWSHVAVGDGVVYELQPGRWLHLGLGRVGVHHFDALATVCRSAPSTAAPTLLAILGGERGPG